MATRSRIGIENPDGTVTSVYCNWDGYPEYNGRILVEYYNTEDRARRLVELGAISTLRPVLAPSGEESHSFDKPIRDVTVAYHRDRGEEFSQQQHKSVAQYFNGDIQEYGYLFTQKGEWLVKSRYTNDGPVRVIEKLDELDE